MHRKQIGFGLLALLIISLVLIWAVALPLCRENHVRGLLQQLRRHRDPIVVERILDILDKGEISPKLGAEVLREVLSPKILVRDNYLAGGRAFVDVEISSDLNSHDLVSDYSGKVIAGSEILYEIQTQSSLRKGVISSFEFTKGTRSDGKVVPLVEPGVYTGRIILKFQLLPNHPSKLAWPSPNPFPWNLWPERIRLNFGKKVTGTPSYAFEVDLPVYLRMVSNAELIRKGVKRGSVPSIDTKSERE